jgi:phytoene dehydrogenase-like protein
MDELARAGTYDVVVVGGGHNGLVGAALFAKAGLKTVVFEAREHTGGCTDTSAPWPEHPDWRVNTYSYVAGLMPRRLVRELDLERHGLRILPFGPYFHAFPDGRGLVLHDDAARCRDSIAQFSTHDADAWEKYEAWLGGVADVLWPLFLQAPPRLGSWRPGDLRELLGVAWKARGLGVRGAADLTRLFTASVNDILGDWFESDEVKAIPAMTATIGAWAGPAQPGTAYVLLHLSMGDAGDGHVGGWGFARGGMGGLAAACRRAAEASGAEIVTAAPVARIDVAGGAVRGVTLADGREIRASLVVSTVHPKRAFLDLMDRGELPGDFVAAIERFKCRGGGVKINLALGELPQFTAAPSDRIEEHHTGSIELAVSPAYVQAAFDDAVAGRPAARPVADGTLPSTLDDTLMPAGMHCLSLFTQWVPDEWVAEPHRDELEAYADRVVDAYAELAPNLKGSILARQVIGPYDLEQELGLVGGNVYGGELSVDQLFHMRPAPGYADYRTPIRGLYNGSAGAHGGGGVSGIPGWQAYRTAMKDRAADARRARLRRTFGRVAANG